MHKAFIATLTAAAMASALGSAAAAMTSAAPFASTAPAHTPFVQQAVNVCGTNGCVKVQVAPPRKRPPPQHRP